VRKGAYFLKKGKKYQMVWAFQLQIKKWEPCDRIRPALQINF